MIKVKCRICEVSECSNNPYFCINCLHDDKSIEYCIDKKIHFKMYINYLNKVTPFNSNYETFGLINPGNFIVYLIKNLLNINRVCVGRISDNQPVDLSYIRIRTIKKSIRKKKNNSVIEFDRIQSEDIKCVLSRCPGI